MRDDKIVTINGRKFDAATGLLVKNAQNTKPEQPKNHKINSSTGLHSLTQRSKTLYRIAAQRPVGQVASGIRKVGRNMDIAMSKNITRFTPQITKKTEQKPVQKPQIAPKNDIVAPVRHPLAQKADNHIQNKIISEKPIEKTPHVIKQEAIAEAMIKITEQKAKEIDRFKRHSSIVKIISIVIGLIFLIVISSFIYLSIPSLSVNIVSAQSGIAASAPEYIPEGYTIDGPAIHKDNSIIINFKQSNGQVKFTLTQSKSTWDSSALKNKIDKETKGKFLTTEERGLTIFTYNGNASWINGGILYSINGDTPLTGDQIRRIATSL